MDQAIEVDMLTGDDQQAALTIINQLGECHTRAQLNQLLITTLIPLMDCSGAFYARLEGDRNTPHLVEDINQSPLSSHSWQHVVDFAMQTPLLQTSNIGESTPRLATDAFCCIGEHCSSLKNCYQSNYCCAMVALFDSDSPSVVLCFCRLKSQQIAYSWRDFELLQILRVTLLQTIKAIIFQEQCRNFQQMLDHLTSHSDPLAVFNNDGVLVYKNQAFDSNIEPKHIANISMLSPHADHSNSQKRAQQNFMSRVGRRLYEVTLAPVNAANYDNEQLFLLRFSRITDKNGQFIRQLDQAGLTRRELEIAALIHQGVSTRAISDQLNLSYHTVRNHIKHIYCKINVSTRSEMLAWGG